MKRAMIVSGPTREAIDPVRYIGNRSSGTTGYHLAETARSCGFEPFCFISGPVNRLPRSAAALVEVETAEEMREAVMRRLEEAEVVVMAAAVSDYRPDRVSAVKIKKGEEELLLRLVRNPDILAEIGRRRSPGQLVAGFAAETENGPQNAREKLLRKNVDLIVLNLVTPDNPAFGDCPNRVCLVTREACEELPPLGKEELARRIWGKIAALAEERGG